VSRELALTDRAALALLNDAERALAEVSTPEDADELWRKVRAVEEAARLARLADATVAAMARVRLRAKRRWGELLPAPESQPRDEKGRVTGGNTDGADRVAQHRARRLSQIDAETFESALASSDPDRPPSEAALLRAASSQGQQRHADDGPASANPVAKVTAYFSDDERQRKAEDDLPLEEALGAVAPEHARAWLQALRDERRRVARLIERAEAATDQRTKRDLEPVRPTTERGIEGFQKLRAFLGDELDLRDGTPDTLREFELEGVRARRAVDDAITAVRVAAGEEPLTEDERAGAEALAERAGIELL